MPGKPPTGPVILNNTPLVALSEKDTLLFSIYHRSSVNKRNIV
jgi:hypothetical protein